jgi:hypothetical protein
VRFNREARIVLDERRIEMSDYSASRPSAWTIGGVTFASTIMILVGIFQAFAGLAAIIDDQFYIVTQNYAFDLDVSAWGWVHLILGIVVAIAGFALWQRKVWAATVAIFLAMLSAIANFFFIPYYPFWSILMIALAIWVIWALTRPGAVGE